MEGGQGGRWALVAPFDLPSKPNNGGRARGEMGGGTREQCGSNKRCTENLTTGAGAKAWGGWPREEMGAPESS